MLILAIESSAKPVSVAVLQATENRVTGDNTQASNASKLLGLSFQNNGFSHSRTLMAMTESLLKNLEMKPSDIDLVAVSKGPGSFTGVRIGVSAAKGLAWGLDIPVCGVSTLEAMAYQTCRAGVIICPVMDARREQVYNALFECRSVASSNLETQSDSSANPETQADAPVRLCDDRAISFDDLAADLKKYTSPILLIGDGINVCKANPAFADCLVPQELNRYQTAYGVALAAQNAPQITAAELEPHYLRPSQAERELNKLQTDVKCFDGVGQGTD